MRSYNSRVFGYPEAKPRENRKRVSYYERLTHALAIVSERAKRASSVMFVFNLDFRYVRIYIYICMWSYVKLCMRMLGGTYCGRGLMSTTF